MRPLVLSLVAGLLVADLAVPASWLLGDASTSPFDETNLVIGYEVYQSDCSGCHGYRLQGGVSRAPSGQPAPALGTAASDTWRNSDRELLRIITNQTVSVSDPQPHRQFETSLAQSEAAAVIAFLKAHWTGEERAAQSVISANVWSFPWPWRTLTWKAPPGCLGAE